MDARNGLTVASSPVVYKGVFHGAVVTVSGLRLLSLLLIGRRSNGNTVDNDQEFLLTEEGTSIPSAGQLTELSGTVARAFSRLPEDRLTPDPDIPDADLFGNLLALRTAIAGAPLSMLTLSSKTDVYGQMASPAYLYFLGTCSTALLLTAFVLQRMRQRSVQLQAEYAASVRHQTELEQRNRALSDEIARRQEVEAALHQKSAELDTSNAELLRHRDHLEEIVSDRTLALSIAKEVAEAKGLQWIRAIDPLLTKLVVIGDPLHLQQVLLNLVGNALKFTAHGSVTLSVPIVRETDQDLDIRCTVRYPGVGIGAEALRRIFDPFEQADGSTTRQFGGTGLGLMTQVMVQELLGETIGFSVDLARDGVQAVELARTNDYALVLMDIQMPEMDGIEATRRIRQIPDRERLPIIAMTANAVAEERSRCLAAGMNDFISKPVEPELLFVTLLGWLDKGSVTRDAAGSQEIP